MKSKLLVICSTAMLASSPAFAFDGPYVGLSLGVDSLIAPYTLTVTDEADSLIHLADASFNGGINIGWGFTHQQLYFAPELNIHYTATEIKQTVDLGDADVSSVKLKNDYDYGGAVKLGMLVNDAALVYAKAGLSFGEYKLTVVQDGVSVHDKKWITAWTTGFGVDVKVSAIPNLIIGTEYTYTRHTKGLQITDDEGDLLSTRLRNHRINAVIRYSFM